MLEWSIKTIALKDLKDHPTNPRQINRDQLHHLENLIKKFGLIDKPVVNLDMKIIGGHQRVRILKKMKQKEVDCWAPNKLLNKEDLDHLCIGLNLNQGKFDYDILANSWDPIELLKWGFTEEQLVGCCVQLDKLVMGDKEEEKDKKKKCCPNCGHEL